MTERERCIVARATDEGFVPFERYGKVIEGFSWRNVSYDAATGQGSFLLRVAPGARSVPHEHMGPEEFYVMEGELRDHDGATYRTGDFVSLRAGSRHWSTSPSGCTLLVFLRCHNRPLEPGETPD